MMALVKTSRIFCAFALSAIFTLTLTSCGGGGSRATVPVNPPMKTPKPANPPVADTRLADARAAALAAYEAAKQALDDVTRDREADEISYAAAVLQVAAAKVAADQASAATTLEAAELAQRSAEAAKTEAMKYAGTVMDAHATQLASARGAATAAYEAAKQALDDVMANKDADMDSYATATEKVAAAKTASDKAQAAETLEAAELAKRLAETAKIEAMKYTGMVMDAHTVANKGALAMEEAIDASSHVKAVGNYGLGDPQWGGKYYYDDPLEVKLGFHPQGEFKKDELPAVFDDLGGDFTGQVYVRTIEDKAKGQTVRDKFYYFTNEELYGGRPWRLDNNYLEFGFWIKETEKDGVITYNNVQPSVQVMTQTTIKEGKRIRSSHDHLIHSFWGYEEKLDAVEGIATYSGPAVGAYLHKTSRPDGTLDTAAAGVFVADVNLTAHFGGEDVPANKQFSMIGAITNFRLSGGQENAWTLKLEAEDVRDNYTTYREFTNGTTNGGGKAGKWSGVFFDDEDSQAARINSNKVVPGYMMGKFKGYFLNGAVAGAYGAQKE